MSNNFVTSTYDIDSQSFIYSYYIALAASTILCPWLIYKTKIKIQSIIAKESYCVISVVLNVMSMINLII